MIVYGMKARPRHGLRLVVKVTDSWPACHEFEPNTAEDPTCKGAMHVRSVEDQTFFLWCGVEVGRGATSSCVALVEFHSLGSKLHSPLPNVFE
ncbi:hypothetical protein TNCV_2767101 [Trichonephila clavipes]|nr:hypothetical protein TNCV_2767101 [Trichonephila clavipes]